MKMILAIWLLAPLAFYAVKVADHLVVAAELHRSVPVAGTVLDRGDGLSFQYEVEGRGYITHDIARVDRLPSGVRQAISSLEQDDSVQLWVDSKDPESAVLYRVFLGPGIAGRFFQGLFGLACYLLLITSTLDPKPPTPSKHGLLLHPRWSLTKARLTCILAIPVYGLGVVALAIAYFVVSDPIDVLLILIFVIALLPVAWLLRFMIPGMRRLARFQSVDVHTRRSEDSDDCLEVFVEVVPRPGFEVVEVQGQLGPRGEGSFEPVSALADRLEGDRNGWIFHFPFSFSEAGVEQVRILTLVRTASRGASTYDSQLVSFRRLDLASLRAPLDPPPV